MAPVMRDPISVVASISMRALSAKPVGNRLFAASQDRAVW
jgi:hypothetical protein